MRRANSPHLPRSLAMYSDSFMIGTIASAIGFVNSARFASGRYDAQMSVRDIRLQRLNQLLAEHENSKVALARTLKKAPAQISQWCNGVRTISEETARELERNARRPDGWFDSLDAPGPLKYSLVNVEPLKVRERQVHDWPFSNQLLAAVRKADAVQREQLENIMRATLGMKPLQHHKANAG